MLPLPFFLLLCVLLFIALLVCVVIVHAVAVDAHAAVRTAVVITVISSLRFPPTSSCAIAAILAICASYCCCS